MDTRGDTVCFVCHGYYPQDLGLQRETRALVEDGVAVHVVCLRDRMEADRETVGGVFVHRLPLRRGDGSALRRLCEYAAFFVLACVKIAALQVRHRFAAVQANAGPDCLALAAGFPRLRGAKVVLRMYEPAPERIAAGSRGWLRPLRVALARLGQRVSVAFSDRVLTATREMRQNLGLHGADVNQIAVVVDAPDEELFRLDRYAHRREMVDNIRRAERRRGTFRVFTHGGAEERCGHRVVVGAVARLRDEIPGIQFRFTGHGPHADGVMALARRLRVSDHVTHLGWLSPDELVEEILVADVTVVPPTSNAYSNLVHTRKMYEYVALQRPVVASRLRSTLAYFPEDTLVYYDSADEADLAARLRYVYAHPEEMEGRVEAAAEVYETHRWSRESKKYLGVYRSLLGRAE